MLWKKRHFAAISMILLLGISGCTTTMQTEIQPMEVEDMVQKSQEDVEKLQNICGDLYENAAKENKFADLE